ncbi:MAG: flavin reductase [Clostridiales bacterium]|nr:flavin reductase [Clostridiales bacterium]
MNFETDIFSVYDKKWALLTAGDKDKYNTMTVSWGGLGTLWSKPVATVYVRTSRLTHDFMDNGEYFTVSFYPESYRQLLLTLGSKSGRDINKMDLPELTAKEICNTVTFEEAEITLVCKKLFKQKLDPSNMLPEIAEQFYKGDAEHDMYIGEVVDIIR